MTNLRPPSPTKAAPRPKASWRGQSISALQRSKRKPLLRAEEAFAKSCAEPRVIIPTEAVVNAAQKCGTTNFARFMQTHGFHLNGNACLDGPFNSVNWTNPAILASAIHTHGPVKIGVGAKEFQTNPHGTVTPGTSGWTMYNYPENQPEDHCASLCGYGTFAELAALFLQYNITVPPPSGMPSGLCYAMFIWNSIGIIDQQSMLNMTNEAWIRTPVTIIKNLGT